MTSAKYQKDPVRQLSTLAVMFGALVLSSVSVAAESADPLPSWTDGDTKTAIKHFVRDVTNESGTDFVPPAQRIAVFDNDGTLWSDTPWVQGLFLVQALRNAVARSLGSMYAVTDRPSAYGAMTARASPELFRLRAVGHNRSPMCVCSS